MTSEPLAQVVAADGFDGAAAVHVQRQGDRGAIRSLDIEEATYTDEDFLVVAYEAGMNVVGTSEPIAADETFDGALSLDRPLTETQTVTVVLHHDEDGGHGD
ncbi:DUF7282 domain-containing protein [Natronorarus salvus]|uniref:DUF7282 domain-containing protein n=1 Tax=Natronorarus salvus TaxID=3117733 RepID=UPI002F264F12